MQKRAIAGTVTNRENSGNCVRTRVGIELTPVATRIVEVVDRRRGWRVPRSECIVRAFGVWPPVQADLDAALASLRGKAAAVVVWGTASEHRQAEVSIGSYENMRAQALRTLADDGVPTRGVWADIAPAGPADDAQMRVVVSAASAKQMVEALQPLTDAGIRLRTVITPAAALAAIARSRHAFSVPDTTEAYIALDNTLTCIALIRNGALIAAHELAWGFLDDCGPNRQPRRRDDIAAHLGDELAELFTTHRDAGPVTQVCICGGLPELRSTTLPLMERFDVEVEILDSLSGIDVRSLAQPADEFRERVSELRMAWVAAADWTTINLLRPNRRRASHAALSRAAVVAGVAAGLGGGWSIARGDSMSVAAASPAAPPRSIANAITRPGPSLLSEASPRAAIPEASLIDVEGPTAAPAPPPPIIQEPVAPKSEPAYVEEIRLPPIAAAPTSIQMEPPPIRTEPPPIHMEPPAIRHEPPVGERRVMRRAPLPPAQVSTPLRRPAGDLLPFDAALSSILFSADRQLAIIDGRVVGRGDAVRDATVVEISAGVVLLRDSQGRLRRLSTGGAGR
jgi:hypothetical protein